MQTKTLYSHQKNKEITHQYFSFIDNHLDDLLNGRETEMLELNDIAKQLFVSHKHLIAIIKETKGEHPCHFYVQKILERTKKLLLTTDWPVAEIARRLSYDPSNFTKFFKKYIGVTPKQFREQHPKK